MFLLKVYQTGLLMESYNNDHLMTEVENYRKCALTLLLDGKVSLNAF